jgi:ribulose 1,5-bisphosphate carboxylase large subunit-like protein
MWEATMENLEKCFRLAKENGQLFVVVKIEMDGFPAKEYIVNPIENADLKLEYYKKTYDENLNHKYAKGIKIVDFTYGEELRDLEDIF